MRATAPTLIEAFRVVRQILPPQSRREAVILFLCMLVNSLMELVGVAGIFPLAAAAADPTLVDRNHWLSVLYRCSGFTSHKPFIVALGISYLTVFVLTNCCNAVTYWLCARFSLRASHHLATSLLERYLHRPYAWFLRHHSADLTRNILDETNRLVEFCVLRLATMSSRAVTAMFICFGLLWLDPMVALTTGIGLSLLYSQIYRFFKARLSRIGDDRVQLNGLRYRLVSQALGTVKEARAYPTRRHFVDRFSEVNYAFNERWNMQRLIGELPRHCTEVLAMVAIVGVLLYVVIRGGSAAQAYPVLCLYIMATWRLVPALQKIYNDVVEIRFHLPLLWQMRDELADTDQTMSEAGGTERLTWAQSIRLENATYTYPEASAPAVRNLTLDLGKGTSTALVGLTGAGKTTIADLVGGYLIPQAGSVTVDGHPLRSENLVKWQRNLGYVPQEIYIIDDTVRRNIALGLPDADIDEQAIERAARTAGIHAFVTTQLDNGYDTVLGERGVCLSGGERQRIGIARALYHDPDLLIFDEATSSLDNLTENAVMAALQALARQKTMIVIAHRLSTVQACDTVCLIQGGELTARGTYQELLEQSPALRALAQPPAEGRAVLG